MTTLINVGTFNDDPSADTPRSGGTSINKYLPYKVYNVLGFGVVGDGVTDDTSALSTVIAAAAAANATLYFPGQTYLVSRLLVSATDNLQWIGAPGATLKTNTSGTTQQGFVDIRGTVTTTTTTLSSTATLGDTSLTVAATPFSTGDVIEIESAAAVGGQTPYLYEINKVTSVSGGVTINLQYPVRNTYSTASTVTIRKITPLTNVSIAGLTFRGSGGSDGDNLRIQHALSPVVRDCVTTAFGDRGIILYRCQHGLIDHCEAYAGADATNSWGIALHSCEGTRVRESVVRDQQWDGFDSSYGTMYSTWEGCNAFNCGDFGFIAGHGLHGHHLMFDNCVVVGTGTGGFTCGNPSFSGDDDVTFRGCRVVGTSNPFMVRQTSARIRFVACRSQTSAGSAFIVQDSASDVELYGCDAISPTTFGYSFQSSNASRAFGGLVSGAGSTGIRISGSPDCRVQGTKITGSVASHNVAVLAGSHRTHLIDVEANSAGGSNNGIHVNASTDVVIVDPTARSNGAYGVQIFESAGGDSARSRIIRGFYSANATAPTTSNNSAESAITGAAPSVAGNEQFVLTQSGGTTVTNLADAADGQSITIRTGDANTTLANNANISLQGGANFVLASGAIVSLRRLNGVWQEIARRTP